MLTVLVGYILGEALAPFLVVGLIIWGIYYVIFNFTDVAAGIFHFLCDALQWLWIWFIHADLVSQMIALPIALFVVYKLRKPVCSLIGAIYFLGKIAALIFIVKPSKFLKASPVMGDAYLDHMMNNQEEKKTK